MREASRSLAGRLAPGASLARRSSSPKWRCRSCCSRARACCCARSSRCGRVDLGVPPDRLLTLRVPLPAAALSRCARAESPSSRSCCRGSRACRASTAVGREQRAASARQHVDAPPKSPATPPSTDPVQVHHVSADYTNALGIRLAAGRLLTDGDVERRQPVALVNERFVRTRFPDGRRSARSVRLPRLQGAAVLRAERCVPDRRRRARHAERRPGRTDHAGDLRAVHGRGRREPARRAHPRRSGERHARGRRARSMRSTRGSRSRTS